MRLSPFSLHSKVSILISLLAIAALISAFLLSGIIFRVFPTRAASALQPGITQGTLTPVATANPGTLSSGASLPKGARLIHPKNNASITSGASRVTSRQGPSSITQANASTLLENFNGVSSRNSAKTNFGSEFEPPDQGLCVGNGFVVEPVNSAYTIYHTNGSVVAGPFNVNKLFNEGLKEFTSDPRCYFDKSTHTWFASILFIASSSTSARIDLAVNPSGNPTTAWTVYHIDATDDGTNGTPAHDGCPCFGDQPLLGIDSQNIYISTNEFSITGPQMNGAQIYAISKSQLVSKAQSVDFVHFDNLTNPDNSLATSVQPAITNGPADAEYFMNSIDPSGTSDNRIGVWALTNPSAVSSGGTPTLSSIVIASEPFGVPPGAIQKGAASLIETGDDRMQQVQYINGNLWGALDTVFTPPNDTAPRAAAAWFEVQSQLNGAEISTAQIQNQGYVASQGNYLLYPAIQATAQGIAGIVMTLSGANYFPSAAYALLQSGQTSFGPIHLAAPGRGHYSTSSTRWGDYSWAILDPDHNTFWMATEYIPPATSQTADRAANWGTRILEVKAGG